MNLPVWAIVSTAAAKLPWSCSGEPEGAYIQKSSKALFYSTLLLVFLAFVHAMKNKIKEKLKIWLYLQVSFKPDSSTNKKLKFKFQSLF